MISFRKESNRLFFYLLFNTLHVKPDDLLMKSREWTLLKMRMEFQLVSS